MEEFTMKKNKKVLTAALALGTSVTLLAGGAYAWWTASKTASTNGNFEIGSLEIGAELYKWTVDTVTPANSSWEAQSNILVTDMVPGDSAWYAIKVENKSSFAVTPNLTLEGTAGKIVDTKANAAGTQVSETTYMVSKMIIMDVTYDHEATVLTELDDPVARTVGTTDTKNDQTEEVAGSIYALTDRKTKDYKYVANDGTDDVMLDEKGGTKDYYFLLIEFHFSGEAGNEYQKTKMTIQKIIIDIEEAQKDTKVI